MPADGALTGNPRPLFTGTGEPGARVEVHNVDPATGALSTITSATVDPTGHWAASPSLALSDGPHTIHTSQVDPAGNRSPDDVRTIAVDTIALAPVLDSLPSQPLVFLPNLTGTAEPGASVSLRDELGAVLGTALSGADGRWTIPLPDPGRDGATVSARQTDLAGNTSSWSAASSALTFDRPSILSPAPDATIPSTAGSTIVQIELAGQTGMQVEVFVDGLSTGNVHTLESTPISRVTVPLGDGLHTLGVRYIDPVAGTAGSLNTIPFTIT
jgi:hypothetical protein